MKDVELKKIFDDIKKADVVCTVLASFRKVSLDLDVEKLVFSTSSLPAFLEVLETLKSEFIFSSAVFCFVCFWSKGFSPTVGLSG